MTTMTANRPVTARKKQARRTSPAAMSVQAAAEETTQKRDSFQLKVFRVFTVFVFVAAVWASLIAMTRVVIPMVASFIGETSGLRQGSTFDAMIATWLAPFLFVLALLFWGETIFVKWFWRWCADVRARAVDWPLMQSAKDVPVKTARRSLLSLRRRSRSEDSITEQDSTQA